MRSRPPVAIIGNDTAAINATRGVEALRCGSALAVELDVDGGFLVRARLDHNQLENRPAFACEVIKRLGMEDWRAVGLDNDVAGLDTGRAGVLGSTSVTFTAGSTS